MKRNITLLTIFLALCLTALACGNDGHNKIIPLSASSGITTAGPCVVAGTSSLPACGDDNNGSLYFITESPSHFEYCADEAYHTIDLTGAAGISGTDGTDGLSITWLGSLEDYPASPSMNTAFYHSAEKKAYIWDGDSWEILAQDGTNGLNGVSITWLGNNTTAPVTCSAGTLNNAYYNTTDGASYICNGTSWNIITRDGRFGHAIMVGKSGADFTTIWQAVNSITDASDTNRYLVLVTPGVYEGGAYTKPYVYISGLNRDTVIIKPSLSVYISSNSALENVTVLNDNPSASPYNTGIASGGNVVNAEIRNVKVVINYASSMERHGIDISTAEVKLSDVDIYVENGNYSYGIYAHYGAKITGDSVTIHAANASSRATSVYAEFDASVELTNSHLIASSTGSGNTTGLYAYDSYGMALRSCLIEATGGGYATGVEIEDADDCGDLEIYNSSIIAEGASNKRGER